MSTHLMRKMALAIPFGFLGIASAHASGMNPRFVPRPPQATIESVTGGDPEPTSPKILQRIFAIVHLE